jgi:general secretion pathway protein L
MPEQHVRLRVLQAATLTVQSLRWWIAELRSLAHDILGFIAPKWNQSLTVFVDAGRVRVYDGDSHTQQPLIDSVHETRESGLPESLAAQIADTFQGGRRARLILNANKAYIRRLRMPIAAMPHLKNAISLQLPKLMPIAPSQLLTDFEAVTANLKHGFIDLAAIKRSEVDPMVIRLATMGLRVTTVHVSADPALPPRFRFNRTDGLGGESKIRYIDRLLVTTATVLVFACGALGAAESIRAQHALNTAKSQTLAASRAALGRRQLLLSKLDPLRALSELESNPAAALLVAEITAQVPHDAWITTLEIKDRHVRLVGISPDSAGVVKLLSSSPLLEDVELRSSMSAGIGTGRDRFEIIAGIIGKSP